MSLQSPSTLMTMSVTFFLFGSSGANDYLAKNSRSFKRMENASASPAESLGHRTPRRMRRLIIARPVFYLGYTSQVQDAPCKDDAQPLLDLKNVRKLNFGKLESVRFVYQ